MTEAHDPKAAVGDDPLTDHEYDGILEYDNPLPRWWVWIFWGSIFFSFGYYFHYHVSAQGASVAAIYDEEMREHRELLAKAAMGSGVSEEGLAKLMKEDSLMADAAVIFRAKCAQCHEPDGSGKIGPNLTDAHWIHGDGSLMKIYENVDVGVTAKGMPAWGRQLSPIELQKVVAFVGTLRNKNLPGKKPEGKKVDPPTNDEPAPEPPAPEAN